MISSHRTWIFAASCILFLAGAAGLPATARGQQSEPACPQCRKVERGIPFLSDIPYVGRLFRIAGYDQDQPASPQEFERIGIDFGIAQECPQPAANRLPLPIAPSVASQPFVIVGTNAPPAPQPWAPVPFGQAPSSYTSPQVFQAAPFIQPAPSYAPAGFCQATSCSPASRCQTAASCQSSLCCQIAACCKNGECREECAEGRCCQAASHEGLSWELVVELTADNAALEATLAAQSEFQKERSGLLDSLVQVSLEKGKLEAQVELHAKHLELTREMLALISENARLKAQAELAEQKMALIQGATQLALENHQLKQQIAAAATAKHSDSAKEVQTSNRHPESKAAR